MGVICEASGSGRMITSNFVRVLAASFTLSPRVLYKQRPRSTDHCPLDKPVRDQNCSMHDDDSIVYVCYKVVLHK